MANRSRRVLKSKFCCSDARESRRDLHSASDRTIGHGGRNGGRGGTGARRPKRIGQLVLNLMANRARGCRARTNEIVNMSSHVGTRG